jgi:predicted amidophosphoribosyltransferase
MIDERSGMQAVGDVDRFLRFRAAKAIGDVPASMAGGGGEAASGMGLGLGAGLGMMVPGMLFKSFESSAKKGLVNCPECYGEVTVDSRFCPHCGHQMVVIRKCPRCDKNITATANFCPSCGVDLKTELRCASCEGKLLPGTRFCPHCGDKVPG